MPEKLVYTWYDGGGGTHEPRSLVAVKFEDKGGGTTELTLSHGLFSDLNQRNRFSEFWNAVLESLDQYLRSNLSRG